MQLKALFLAVVVALLVAAPAAAQAPPAGPAPCDPTQTPPEFRGQVPAALRRRPEPGRRRRRGDDRPGVRLHGRRRPGERPRDHRRPRPAFVGGPRASLGDHRHARTGSIRPSIKEIQQAAQTLRDPQTSPTQARYLARRLPGDPLGGVERARRRGVRDRGLAAGALRARRPRRLRRAPDPRQRDRRPAADPEPRWPRGGHAAQPLRLRHEPRLVRPHPARDRRQARDAARVPRPAVHRRARDGRRRATSSRPTPTRSTTRSPTSRSTGSTTSTAPRWPPSSTARGSTTSTAASTTSSTWATATPCPRPGSISAGMTYEKGGASPISDRAYEQYLTQWVSLSQAAIHKEAILRQWAGAWREAYRPGRAGCLEPNELVNPGDLDTRGPRHAGAPVLHHRPARRRSRPRSRRWSAVCSAWTSTSTSCARACPCPTSRPTAAHTREQWMPPGTWYVPMAQMQKHWVQAMLNEDTYTPFPYFYDVTAWSQPLLFNVQRRLLRQAPRRRSASRVDELPDPGAPAAARRPAEDRAWSSSPRTASAAIESTGWLRYLLERVWHIAVHERAAPPTIGNGALDGYDVVLLPNGPSDVALDTSRRRRAAGAAGLGQRRRPSDLLARRHRGRGGAGPDHRGRSSDPTSDIPGSLFRVRSNPDSPLHSRRRRRGVRLL